MFDFFNRLFRPAPPSGSMAKERLRLVLLSDHLSLAPDVVDALKRDLLEVISRYVEIDPAHADVTFEQRDREVAMLASIPITGVRERERPRAPEYRAPAPSPAPAAFDEPAPVEVPTPVEVPAPAEAPAGEPVSVDAPAAEPEPEPERDPPEAARVPVASPVRSANGAPPRRRRRKKAKAAAPSPAPHGAMTPGSASA